MGFRDAQDYIYSKSAQQTKIYVLISQPHQTIAVALMLTCLNMQSKQTSTNSTAVLLKPSHYFLLWNRVGFLRMLPACNPLGGNIMGSKLQAMVTGFLSVQQYIIRHDTWHSKHTSQTRSSRASMIKGPLW